MKKILTTLALATTLASPAMALTIQGGTINVGALDQVVGVRSGGSASPEREANWVNSVLGTSGYSITSNTAGTNILYRTSATDVVSYAFNVAAFGGPEYVLVKNSTTFLLVHNTGDTNWLVFNWADEVEIENDHDEVEIAYDLNGNGDDRRQTSISHFAAVFGPPVPETPPQNIAPPPVDVPEPATLGLMGLGLIAAGLRRRKSA